MMLNKTIFRKTIPVFTVKGNIFFIQFNHKSLKNVFILNTMCVLINNLNVSKNYYLLNYITQRFDVKRKFLEQNKAFPFFSNIKTHLNCAHMPIYYRIQNLKFW